MTVSVQAKVDALNRAFAMYMRASKRTIAEMLNKQSSELSRNLAKAAKGLMPAKGWITASRIEAFRVGEGLRIRPDAYAWAAQKYNAVPLAGGVMLMRTKRGGLTGTRRVKGKRLNLQALAAQRELRIRESGRGFLHHADKFSIGMSRGERLQSRRIEKTVSKYGPSLGQFSLSADVEKGTGQAVFTWGGFSQLSDEAVKAMGRAKGQAAIASAIQATTDNMIPYLEARLGEAAVKAGLRT